MTAVTFRSSQRIYISGSLKTTCPKLDRPGRQWTSCSRSIAVTLNAQNQLKLTAANNVVGYRGG